MQSYMMKIHCHPSFDWSPPTPPYNHGGNLNKLSTRDKIDCFYCYSNKDNSIEPKNTMCDNPDNIMYFYVIFYLFLFSGLSLIESGEALKQMAEVKYALEDNVKQNFLEPLHHLQTKDLKDVMVMCFFSSCISCVQ